MTEYNASDEKSVEEAEQLAKNERDQELEDIKNILSVPSGLRFFKRLFTEGHVFCTTFTGNSVGYFKEGERNLALKFFDDICEAAPEKLKDLLIKQEGDF